MDMKEYNRAYYQTHKERIKVRSATWQKANPEKTRASGARQRRKKKDYINWAKDRPCVDCVIRYPPCVLDFHHRGDKMERVSRLVGYAWETLIAEIDKCEVVCANCHRLRHYAA